MAKAGIRRDTPSPLGGEIQRDPTTGAATGILLEEGISLIEDALQRPLLEESEQAFEDITSYYHSLGITSVRSFESAGDFTLIRSLYTSHPPRLNLTCHVSWTDCGSIFSDTWQSGTEIDGITLGGIWSAVDGTLTSQTA